MNNERFWNEPAGRRLAGCLGVLVVVGVAFCLICLGFYYRNRQAPPRRENPWRNYDSSRPITDVKALDYDRRWILYRDEEPRKSLQTFSWATDGRMYGDPANCYEDYYEELYEYYHD